MEREDIPFLSKGEGSPFGKGVWKGWVRGNCGGSRVAEKGKDVVNGNEGKGKGEEESFRKAERECTLLKGKVYPFMKGKGIPFGQRPFRKGITTLYGKEKCPFKDTL